MVTVSVVIPTYNSAGTLSRAVDSVLAQTIDNLEIVIVDDASTDHSMDVLDKYQNDSVTVIQHATNQGGSAARNTGVAASNGEYIAFLDADDEWHPKKLERQLDTIRTRPKEYVVVHCDRSYQMGWIDRCREYLAPLIGTVQTEYNKEGGTELIKEVLLMNLSTGASTLLVKRTAYEEIGGFDPTFDRHQDWEFLIRLLQVGKLAHVNEALVTKHITETPSGETFEQGKKRLFDVFDTEIACLESDGHNITHVHNLHLSKMYIENGDLVKGMSNLKITNLSPPDMLGLGWSTMVGFRTLVKRALKE